MAKDEWYRIAEKRVEKALQHFSNFGSVQKILDLSWLKLTELPESLCQLTQLQGLLLDFNQLTNLPESLAQLTQLQTLELASNQLTNLPESLAQLTQLRSLNLSRNRLSLLPKSLGQLTQLQSLNLSGNHLTFLPESLGQLTQLEKLYLSNNQMTTLRESLGELTNLRLLDLSHNQLTELPRSLSQLKLLDELYLYGNDGLGLPSEIQGTGYATSSQNVPPNPIEILGFYFGQRQEHAKPLNEVKLLLVGHGRVGKTSLSKALRGDSHNDQELETPGIERYPLLLTASDGNITAHVWDFGGQEFLHQTHQFFFSQRSLYLIVLSGRQGQPMQEAEYWLRLIRTYGAGSPVVIALNQIKAHPFSVDEYFLKEKYPEVKAVVRTDCDPRDGIAELRELLARLAGEAESVRQKIKPAWARIRTQLEEMRDSFVTFDRYREICAGQGVEEADDQDILATILDCLGIALNYRDDLRLRDTSVLKPRWLVDGIYTILRWLQHQQTNGTLRLSDFPQALPDTRNYPPHMHRFLLALLEKFELCFQVENAEELYLVPALLVANQPHELSQFTGGAARRMQLRYDEVRPPGLLPRFIVRSHTLSEGQARWRHGVVLVYGEARALVRGDHEGRVTDVFVLGEQADERLWLNEFILSEMRVLNEKLPVRTFIESEGAWSELEVLREAAQRHEPERAERLIDGRMVRVSVTKTLREVESVEASAPREAPLPLFICFAHANERTVKQLLPSLKVLARRGHIAPWRDTDLIPGDDWDETIKERLTQARIILLMVSREFLASDYIAQHERPLAMQLMRDQQAIVVPIILAPCTWTEEKDLAVLEVLPRKGTPVSGFNPRVEAWKLVEEGIKKAAEQARDLPHVVASDFRRMPRD